MAYAVFFAVYKLTIHSFIHILPHQEITVTCIWKNSKEIPKLEKKEKGEKGQGMKTEEEEEPYLGDLSLHVCIPSRTHDTPEAEKTDHRYKNQLHHYVRLSRCSGL